MEETLQKFVQHSIWTTVHIRERRIAPEPILQSGKYKKGIGNVKVRLFSMAGRVFGIEVRRYGMGTLRHVLPLLLCVKPLTARRIGAFVKT